MKAVFIDLDGTVYYGNKLIEGANDAISYFREKNYLIFFVTNNSTKSRKQIYNKLLKIGVDCKLEEVISSGYIASKYAEKESLKKVYVFGTENLKDELREQGVNVEEGEDAQNLIIGYNPNFTYIELAQAVRVAMNANKIIACNKEKRFPGENAVIMPGCGAMVAPIEWCAEREVDYVIGKPNTLMIDFICEEYGIDKSDVTMIGDTYESDVLMAKRAGCKAICISEDTFHDVVCVRRLKDVIDLNEKW